MNPRNLTLFPERVRLSDQFHAEENLTDVHFLFRRVTRQSYYLLGYASAVVFLFSMT